MTQPYLTPADLLSLEDYAEAREEFRQRAMIIRKQRRLLLGEHFCLHFENRLTVQYQVQEMLRTERTFERAGIEDELAVYNPLISHGSSLRCTLFIEYGDAEERQRELQRMANIEHGFWLQVEGCDKAQAIADEDLERSEDGKTSAVHFMRFEIGEQGRKQLLAGAVLYAGVDYGDGFGIPQTAASDEVRQALIADLSV